MSVAVSLQKQSIEWPIVSASRQWVRFFGDILLNNRAYDEMLTTLFTATDDTIIDHFVLQNIDKTWLLHPSLTCRDTWTFQTFCSIACKDVRDQVRPSDDALSFTLHSPLADD